MTIQGRRFPCPRHRIHACIPARPRVNRARRPPIQSHRATAHSMTADSHLGVHSSHSMPTPWHATYVACHSPRHIILSSISPTFCVFLSAFRASSVQLLVVSRIDLNPGTITIKLCIALFLHHVVFVFMFTAHYLPASATAFIYLFVFNFHSKCQLLLYLRYELLHSNIITRSRILILSWTFPRCI